MSSSSIVHARMENNTENVAVTLWTLWLSTHFPHRHPLLLNDYRGHAWATPTCHLLQPCQGQGIVLCSRTVQAAHTSQINWASGVKRVWARIACCECAHMEDTGVDRTFTVCASRISSWDWHRTRRECVPLVRWWSASFSSEVAQTKPPPATDCRRERPPLTQSSRWGT